MAESKRTEINDYKIRAYRVMSDGDKEFQNYKDASTVELQLFVEIDGIELPLLSQAISFAQWERAIKNYGKDFTQA